MLRCCRDANTSAAGRPTSATNSLKNGAACFRRIPSTFATALASSRERARSSAAGAAQPRLTHEREIDGGDQRAVRLIRTRDSR